MLYIATEGRRDTLHAREWSDCCTGQVQCHEVPCTHAQMTDSGPPLLKSDILWNPIYRAES